MVRTSKYSSVPVGVIIMPYLGNFDIYRCDQCGFELRAQEKRDINLMGWRFNWWDEDKKVVCPNCIKQEL